MNGLLILYGEINRLKKVGVTMADIGTLIMKVKADTDNFESGMGRVNTSVNNTARIVAAATVAIATAVGVATTKFVLMGSEAEEMQNKFDVVFSGMSAEVENWADEYSDAVGRSKFDTMTYLANLADLQQGLGMTTEDSFDLATQIVELGTDLASFNNLQDADAIEAISKAMLGEAESAKTLGLLLNVDRVKAYVEAQGLVYESLTDAEKAQATFNLAVEQSQNAIGDAERSSGSFENQMKELKSSISDAATEFGLTLLPAATNMVSWINDTGLPGFQNMAEGARGLADNIKDTVAPAFDNVKSWFDTNFPDMKTDAADLWDSVKLSASSYISYIDETYGPSMENLGAWFTEKMPEWKEKASQAFGDIEKALSPIVDTITNSLLPAVDDVRVWFIDSLPGMATQAIDSTGEIGDSLITLADTFNDTLGSTIRDNIDDFRDQWPETRHQVQTTIYVIIALMETLAVTTASSIEGTTMIVNDFMEKYEALQTVVSGAFDIMKNDGRSFKEKMVEYMEDVGISVFELRDNFGAVGEEIFDFFAGLGENALNAADKVVEAFNKIRAAWSDPTGYLFDTVNEFINPQIDSSIDTGEYSGFNTDLDAMVNTPTVFDLGAPTTTYTSPVVDLGAPTTTYTPTYNSSEPYNTNNIDITVNGAGNAELVAEKIVKKLKLQGVQ